MRKVPTAVLLTLVAAAAAPGAAVAAPSLYADGRSCVSNEPYGGNVSVTGLQPSTEYTVSFGPGNGAGRFTTDATGAARRVGGTCSLQPIALITVYILNAEPDYGHILVHASFAGDQSFAGLRRVPSPYRRLYNGVLRLGDAHSAPRVTETGGPFDLQINAASGLRFDAAGAAQSVSCTPQPPAQPVGFNIVPGGPEFHGHWSSRSEQCSTSLAGIDVNHVALLGAVRFRIEIPRRSGERDGVVQTIQGYGPPLSVVMSLTGGAGSGSCEYRLSPEARLDVFNPGHGHRIVLDREPLNRIPGPHHPACPGDDDPATVDAFVTQDVRLRAPDAGGDFTLPVWLHPCCLGAP